jgi:hypothetical protein
MYLVPAVVLLALLTSMGIFGFLSKAHMDQGITSGDSQSKLALYDEKIKTQKDNVELARKALTQMDSQVDQMLGRTDNDKGAERAVQIRRQQAKERTALQNDIAVAQKEIQKLNEERAPIAAENRKIEAEVGPIKYIAALIYGDNADQNMLEAAVRWVIILLVVVFDPLAIALVLAANASKDWDDKIEQDVKDVIDDLATIDKFVNQAAVDAFKEIEENEKKDPHPIGWMFKDPGEHPKDDYHYKEQQVEETKEDDRPLFDKYPYLAKPFTHFSNLKPMVATIDEYQKEVKEPTVDSEITIDKEITADSEQKILTVGVDVVDRPGDYVTPPVEIITEGVTKLEGEQSDYSIFEGKSIRKDALKEMHPEMFKIIADGERKSNSNFGTKFPEVANKGDTFVRVDVLPNRVYKFDGKRWIEINKETTDTYLHDREYIKHLVSMIETGQYDVDLLSESEQREIENYIRAQSS